MSRITERLNRWRFQAAVRDIAATPPVVRGDRRFAALSMVHQRDVLAYLLAIKTFARHARPERIVVVADPTLDDSGRSLIRTHVPCAEILDAEIFRRPALPVGGTWERLSAISVLNEECSVVQLDADTVTFDEPTEVVEAACAGRTFVIRPTGDVQIVDLQQAAETGRRKLAETNHIQVTVEARLPELPNAGRYRYVRGCSGFTGFGHGALRPAQLDAVSAQMRAIHGLRWDEWGSEQVTSNLLAASTPDAFLLPHPRYCNADSLAPSTVLAHYIGYARFTSRDYESRARQAARTLKTAPRQVVGAAAL